MIDSSFTGITLAKEPRKDFDCLASIYTKEFGRVTALARGSRKIASKLGAHIEPLRVIHGRLVEKNAVRLADAITVNAFPAIRRAPGFTNHALGLIRFVHENTGVFHEDGRVWEALLAALLETERAASAGAALPQSSELKFALGYR